MPNFSPTGNLTVINVCSVSHCHWSNEDQIVFLNEENRVLRQHVIFDQNLRHKSNLYLENDLYFMITCHVRPKSFEPKGRHKTQVPL